MPDFQGNQDIILQPGDSKVPYLFTFTVCTGATSNDGALPYGTNISSCAVTAHAANTGTDKTSEIVYASSVDANKVTVLLKYPATTGTGWYHLKFLATLDSGAVMEFDFNRLKAKDL